MRFIQSTPLLHLALVSVPLLCALACTPTKIKKATNTLNKAATSCPSELMVYPVERHETSEALPNKDFPIFAGLMVAPDTKPYQALAQGLADKPVYKPLPEDLQTAFAPMRKLPIFVYGPDGKSCKLQVGQLYFYYNPPDAEIAPRVVAQLEGECASFNDKKASNTTVGLSTPALASTCTLNTKLVKVDLASEKATWPTPMDKALDMKSCQAPTCKYFHQVEAIKGKETSVYAVRTTKLSIDAAKEKAIADDTSKSEQERKQALEQLRCDSKRVDVNGTLFRSSAQRSFQMASKGDYEPRFYGWIEDPTGVKRLLFMQHGEFVHKRIKDDALTVVQKIKWYTPHPENIGEDFSLGPYCGP